MRPYNSSALPYYKHYTFSQPYEKKVTDNVIAGIDTLPYQGGDCYHI
jgi:hypothetical protein